MMKKSTLFITLISFILVSFSGYAQQKIHKRNTDIFKKSNHLQQDVTTKSSENSFLNTEDGIISFPGNSEDYWWDTESEDWQHYSNTAYSYSALGKILEIIQTEPMTGLNMSRITYEYDMHGRMIESGNYYWNGSDWEMSGGNKILITYDNDNNIIEEVYQYYDYSSSSWIFAERYSYTYDAIGNMTSETSESFYEGAWVYNWKDIYTYDSNGHLSELLYQNWNGTEWENEFKEVYTVNTNGEWTEVTDYDWDGSDWVPEYKYTDITWQNFNNEQLTGYSEMEWNGSDWENSYKYEATYTGNDYVGIYQYWDVSDWMNEERETYTSTATENIDLSETWENGAWENSYRYTDTYDEYGNYTGYKSEYWENGEWVVDWQHADENTYNSEGDLLETINKFWDYVTMSLINNARRVYSNHVQIGTGINDNNHFENVHIYPNPVSNVVNIKIDDLDVNNYQVEIINITGQLVINNTYSRLSTSINVDKLDKGVYIMRITADNGKVHNYKLFKE